jgi:hypothetical protein
MPFGMIEHRNLSGHFQRQISMATIRRKSRWRGPDPAGNAVNG